MDLDDIVTSICVLIIILIIPTLIIFCGYKYEQTSCQNKAYLMNKESSYGVTTGCMIKVKDEYIPIENYKVIN